MTALEALGHDIEQAVRIASTCFSRGPSGCVCVIMMLIKPAWCAIPHSSPLSAH